MPTYSTSTRGKEIDSRVTMTEESLYFPLPRRHYLVLLNLGVLEHLESGLFPESQRGFRAMRSTKYMIFAGKQLQEKCQVHDSDLLMTFVNPTKAFDIVSREGLRRV